MTQAAAGSRVQGLRRDQEAPPLSSGRSPRRHDSASRRRPAARLAPHVRRHGGQHHRSGDLLHHVRAVATLDVTQASITRGHLLHPRLRCSEPGRHPGDITARGYAHPSLRARVGLRRHGGHPRRRGDRQRGHGACGTLDAHGRTSFIAAEPIQVPGRGLVRGGSTSEIDLYGTTLRRSRVRPSTSSARLRRQEDYRHPHRR